LSCREMLSEKGKKELERLLSVVKTHLKV
jgi:hypothetical protein